MEVIMLPTFLLPDIVAREDGVGTEVALDSAKGKLLQLTLGIDRILEQESLDVSLWGSPDNEHWERLCAFPQKSYCGTYSMLLDLTRRTQVRYLRAQWSMRRWAASDRGPLFGFHIFAEEARFRTAGAA
jgi:hypothetical protein